MRWLSRLVTVGIIAALAGVIVIAVVRVARPPQVEGGFRSYVLFRDASGLPVGSRVVIAGVSVGQIDKLTIEGNLARVDLRLADEVVIWDDAWATKKASSALGDNYVEISPGGPDPDDPTVSNRTRRRLRSGEQIPRVVEATTTDQVMRSIERSLPRLDDSTAAADAFLEEGREWVSGDFGTRMVDLDRRLAAGAIATPLQRLARQTARFDEWTANSAATVAEAAPRIGRRLRSLPGEVDAVTADLRTARADVGEALGTARARVDEVDPYLDDANELLADLGGAPSNGRQGTLARMINDPSIAETIDDTTVALEGSTGTLDRLKTTLGFRVELNFISRQPRFYVTAELAARNDQFYLVEAEKGPTGDNPQVSLTEIPDSTEFARTTFIPERLRFTAQWGRRFGRFALRLGIKESNFGAGGDFLVGRGRLKLSVDAMESSFSHPPRIKLTAALAVFRSLYILGGIDDVLTRGDYLPVQPWANETHPTQFEEARYGRDYYLGFELRIHDNDINRLLMIYGGLIATMLAG